jgi:phosphoglycerate dehydrogenase-like enzyme
MIKIAIELNSSVESFQVRADHLQRLMKICPRAEWLVCEDINDFVDKISECQGALIWSFKRQWYERGDRLKWLITPAAGRDWIEEDPQARVEVHHSSFHGHLIAESFLSMLLQSNQKQFRLNMNRRSKSWDRNVTGPRRSLRGQRLLIVGFGHIGKACAELCMGLGMDVVACSRSPKEELCPWLSSENMMARLSEFDHVLNLLPHHESTRFWFKKEHFDEMKVGACFYNFGRGTTVDQAALVESLNSGHLSSAGLDVTHKEPLQAGSPLWDMDQVLLSPHSSCCYEEYLDLFINEWESFLSELNED